MPPLPADEAMTLGEAHRREIERRRRAAGLPKERLARLAGVGTAQLRAYLNKRWDNPSVGWLERLYQALDEV